MWPTICDCLLVVACFIFAGGFSVFAGVGERTREGNDLYREMIESGVIKLGEKQVCYFVFIGLPFLFCSQFGVTLLFCLHYNRVKANVLWFTVK